jgi:hypothetical protein
MGTKNRFFWKAGVTQVEVMVETGAHLSNSDTPSVTVGVSL